MKPSWVYPDNSAYTDKNYYRTRRQDKPEHLPHDRPIDHSGELSRFLGREAWNSDLQQGLRFE